jgi:hypothetical protein
MFKISFIGAGHVAWHLSQALENAGHSVQEVFSRNPAKAKDVVSYLYNAQVQEHLDFSESTSTVFFLCIPESAYSLVLPELLLPKYATLVLVAGTTSLTESLIQYDPLRESTNQLGVFFPVQHLQAERKISLSHTPICLEVLVEETEALLESIELDKQLIQGLMQNYTQAFFANQVLASNQELAKLQDTRISLDHQSLLEKPEMREIYRNMVELIRQKSI